MRKTFGGIEYEIRKSKRAKRARISVSCAGEVAVTLPWFVPVRFGETLLRSYSEWVSGKLSERKARTPVSREADGRYEANREKALSFVRVQVERWNRSYGFRCGNISVRDQKTRWGSCSKRGNLSFNWRLSLLPRELADYVVVHELCHLREFNHSKAFWDLVAETIPDYKERRKALKNISFTK